MSGGALPEGWAEASLLDVGELVRGVTYTKGDARDMPDPDYIPVLRANNITDHGLGFDGLVYVPRRLVTDEQLVRCGDIVIATSSGSVNVVGKAQQAPQDLNAGFGAFCAVLRPKDIVNARYIGHFLRTDYYRTTVSSLARGVNINNLKRSHFAQIRIPLPPIEEQRRIADKLDALLGRIEASRARLERVPALLRRFRQAVLAAATSGALTAEWREENNEPNVIEFIQGLPVPQQPHGGKPATETLIPGIAALSVNDPGTPLPASWAWVPLLRIARQETGHTPGRAHKSYWDGDIPWIGIRDAAEHHGGIISDTHQHVTSEGLAHSAARLLPAGTVCLSRTASVGYVVIMGRAMATSQDFATWSCTKALDPRYLMYGLLSEGENLRRFGNGSTHTTIYFPEIRALHIALPPLAEQREIVRRVEELFSLADAVQARYAAAWGQVERLPGAVLAKAFRGELG